MLKLVKILVILLLFGIASQSFGFELPDSMKSQANFNRLVSEKFWSIKCENDEIRNLDSEIELHLRQFAETTVYEGLIKLYEINPNLVSWAIITNLNRKMRIICKPGFVAAHRRGNIFRSDLMLVWSVAWNEAVQHNPTQLKIVNAIADRVSGSGSNERALQFNKSVLFHEFLHHLQIDNFKSAFHNNLDLLKIDNPRQKDSIYSCTAQVYPSANNEILFEGDKKYTNSNEACVTCASLDPGQGADEHVVTPASQDQAKTICGGIKKDDFVFPWNKNL